MKSNNMVLVDKEWNIHRIDKGRVLKVETPTDKEAEISDLVIGSVKYFNTPFRNMVAVQDNQAVSEWAMTPFAFHLHSPFDYLEEVQKFAIGQDVYPLDLNITLSDRCNYGCTFCLNREERESKRPKDLRFSTYKDTIDFFSGHQPSLTQSLSCGGSGEAVIHKQFNDVLKYAGEKNIRTFLTTNGSRTDDEYIRMVAQYTSVVVFSIHGITENAFRDIQRPPKSHTLENVIDTIANIRAASVQYGREHLLSLRVLTTVHALNAGNYAPFIQMLIDAGINQISFNPILPSPGYYGINIDEATREAMTREFAQIPLIFRESGVPIRLPDKPFQDDDATFFDPSVRKNRDTCLIALLQPNIGPIYGDNENAKLSACRFYPIITGNPAYWYSGSLGPEKAETVWTRGNIQRIQNEAYDCRGCSNERQIMALDWMLTTVRRFPDARFYLVYDFNQTNQIQSYSQSVGNSPSCGQSRR
jgi:wyosine [tRNA(Phe)-imidazoG37] synthetase (radical SAM superfamily)